MSTVVAGVVGALIGLIAVALGAWLQGRSEHQHWLRDRKLEAATDFVTASRHLLNQYRLVGREGMDEMDGMEEIEGTEAKPGKQEPPAVSKARCTLEQAVAYAPVCRLSPDAATFWWHTRNAADWHRGTAGGGPSRKVSSWQSDMATSRHWAEAGAEKQRESRRAGVRL